MRGTSQQQFYINMMLSLVCGVMQQELFNPFLGAFAKLRKTTISFVVSIRPSVRMKPLGSHRTDFDEI
jgi:hypothetical protein